MRDESCIGFTDVLWFLAELAAYAAVAWWGLTREVPLAVRLLLGLGGIAVFATTWAVFAAPRASRPLRGAANVVFRVAWFGLGAAAGLVAVLGS